MGGWPYADEAEKRLGSWQGEIARLLLQSLLTAPLSNRAGKLVRAIGMGAWRRKACQRLSESHQGNVKGRRPHGASARRTVCVRRAGSA